ncbi:MAG: fructose-6-phosphate aldolase [Bacteroidetes bacterium]|jgi:hypothetical protein|nr:fructose-6-phosphate aldolase [Bacteroidota bacterium]MBT6685560.1 fructose-6-phosphate aldolase [Bacteroidota bacterium]MBT7141965.1 fructose-6-phosphate aldolase [Bacteroidota bacterium]MBT7493123.1 fructose-6-phosphate aldolase [Bacteroidota bacterium]
MYILKTKGSARIPDYIQIRDDDFILLNHFTVKNAKMMIQKYQLQIDESNLNEIIGDLPYGKLKKIEI